MSTPEAPAGPEHEAIAEFRDLLLRTSVRAQRGVRRSIVLAIVIWAGAAGWLWYTVTRVSAMEQRRAQLASEFAGLAATRDSLVRQRDALLAAQGFSPARLRAGVGESDVVAAAAATTARTQAALRASPESRRAIVVDVFSRDVDRPIVDASLAELGFRLNDRAPTATIRAQTLTNAIWYGRDVPLGDVKLVAYTLLQAGIRLYYIEPTLVPGRERVIQVGSIAGPPRRPQPFTVDEIRAAPAFPSVVHARPLAPVPATPQALAPAPRPQATPRPPLQGQPQRRLPYPAPR